MANVVSPSKGKLSSTSYFSAFKCPAGQSLMEQADRAKVTTCLRRLKEAEAALCKAREALTGLELMEDTALMKVPVEELQVDEAASATRSDRPEVLLLHEGPGVLHKAAPTRPSVSPPVTPATQPSGPEKQVWPFLVTPRDEGEVIHARGPNALRMQAQAVRKRRPSVPEAASVGDVRLDVDSSLAQAEAHRRSAAVKERDGVDGEYIDQIVVTSIDMALRSNGKPYTTERNSLFLEKPEASISSFGMMFTSATPTSPKAAAEGAPGTEPLSYRAPDITWQPVCRGGCNVVPMLHPEARFRLFWMGMGLAFILFEAFAIPVYIAFSVEVKPDDPLFVVISIVNSYFIMDVILHLMTGFMDRHGVIIFEPRRVVLNYARTWLAMDIIAGIPWEWIPTGVYMNNLTKSVRIIRAFRMLRLMRLMRIAKLGVLIERMEARLESNHVLQFIYGIVRIAGVLIAVAHWCACIWYGIGRDHYSDLYTDELGLSHPQTWLVYYQENYPFIGSDSTEQYVYALYYCLTTMCTVGYGDITPRSFDEIRFAMVLLVLSSVLFASLMGTLTDMLYALNSRSHELSERKLLLSQYMHFRRVPWKLRMSIRRHLLFVWRSHQGYEGYEQELSEQLSPILKADLCFHLYGDVLRGAPFLIWMREFPSCTRLLAERLRCILLAKEDFVFRMGERNDRIHILAKGKVIVSRIEHLWEMDARWTAMQTSPTSRFNIARVMEASVVADPSRGPSDDAEDAAGMEELRLHTRTSKVLEQATLELRLADIRRRAAAKLVQRTWRRKANLAATLNQQLDGSPLIQTKERLMRSDRLKRRRVGSPSYFGESCLWQPFEEWDRRPAPAYLYTVRCDSRCEFVQIPRRAIKEMLLRFHPWMPDRFEEFRQAVNRSLQGKLQDENFGCLARDWVGGS